MSNQNGTLFGKKNYWWMLGGVFLIALGMFLMSGGQSNTDPSVFNKDAVYSPMRITVAPLLIIAGLVVEVIAIFKK
jgi:drug/metabolite transporter (DMT)-like permease